jgi:hypothetical protein
VPSSRKISVRRVPPVSHITGPFSKQDKDAFQFTLKITKYDHAAKAAATSTRYNRRNHIPPSSVECCFILQY